MHIVFFCTLVLYCVDMEFYEYVSNLYNRYVVVFGLLMLFTVFFASK
jgi:hypothetical protein